MKQLMVRRRIDSTKMFIDGVHDRTFFINSSRVSLAHVLHA